MSVLNCPVCSAAMKEATKNDVTIDVCTRCRGVWLDRGELEKLMAEMQPAHREHAPAFYDDDDDDHHRRHHTAHAPYPHKKRSKFESLMEIFD